MPQVSVIVPAYNAMAFLPQTLDSVLAQTFADFEVWVVNDGSTDPTAEWVSSLTDRRVRLINQANQGCAIARNTGLLAACGQYVAFLDADDLWKPTKLEKQVQLLDSRPAIGLVYTGISTIDETGRPTGKIELPTVEGAVWDAVVEANPIMCGSTPMMRRACFESAGLFDPSLRSAEDWDLWIRIAEKYEFALIQAPAKASGFWGLPIRPWQPYPPILT
ncbi:MAG: glycosyltransferase family A protein [Cyanobacteria bacterium P01_A01_bin.114]